MPRQNEFVREHAGVLGVSMALHFALLLLLALNLELLPRRDPEPVRLAIQATVVDQKASRQRELERQREEQRARDAAAQRRRQAEEMRQRELDARRASEQQEKEARLQQEKAVAEQRREQAQAERRKREAEQAVAERRKREAEQARQARVAEERRQKEEQQRAAAEASRKAEAERREAQTRADLERQLEEEERFAAAESSGLLDQYAEVIRQKVERNWIRPASARSGLDCVVLVRQIPGGEVVDVQVAECNGDAAVLRSIEAAVLRSSPLPPPPDPALFERSLRFEFRPSD